MMRTRVMLLAACLVAVAAFTSFGIIHVTSNNLAAAQEEVSGDGTLIEVSSVEEASEIAGYSVATADPALIGSLTPARNYIQVMLLGPTSEAPKLKAIGQHWQLSDGSWVRLVQVPGLKVIGTPTSVGNAVGGRVFYGADEEMPARLSLYWQVDELGFSLSGTLTDSISEELLRSIAESVKVR